jgi:hypothetical protein
MRKVKIKSFIKNSHFHISDCVTKFSWEVENSLFCILKFNKMRYLFFRKNSLEIMLKENSIVSLYAIGLNGYSTATKILKVNQKEVVQSSKILKKSDYKFNSKIESQSLKPFKPRVQNINFNIKTFNLKQTQ